MSPAGSPRPTCCRPETGIGRGFDVYDATLPPAAGDQAPGRDPARRPGDASRPRPSGSIRSPTIASSCSCTSTSRTRRTRRRRDSRWPIRTTARSPYSDEIVGQFLDRLRRRGWYDDATIVVTADHGEGLGDHQEKEHGLFVYNETIRVPLIVKLPDGRRGGTRDRGARAAHRSAADVCRRWQALPTPGAAAAAICSRCCPARGTIAPQGIYSEALYPRYHFGWSELLVAHRRALQVTSRRRRRSCTISSAIRTNARTSSAIADSRRRRCDPGLEALIAGRDLDAPVGRVRRGSRAARRARLRRHACAGIDRRAPVRSSLPDPKDKAGILATYREAVDLISARKYDAGGCARRERCSPTARHDRRVAHRRRRATRAWAGSRTPIRRTARRFGGNRTSRRAARRGRRSSPRWTATTRRASTPSWRLPARRATAHQTLANIALMQNRPDEALREARLAAAADPTLPTPLLVQGMIEYNEDRFAEALPYLLKARDGLREAHAPGARSQFLHRRLAGAPRAVSGSRTVTFSEELQLHPQNTRARGAGWRCSTSRWAAPQDAERVIQDMLQDVAESRPPTIAPPSSTGCSASPIAPRRPRRGASATLRRQDMSGAWRGGAAQTVVALAPASSAGTGAPVVELASGAGVRYRVARRSQRPARHDRHASRGRSRIVRRPRRHAERSIGSPRRARASRSRTRTRC